MNKLLILLSGISLAQMTFAISLGDTLNQKVAVAAQATTSTSTITLLKSDSKSSTFMSTSDHGKIQYLVNNKTNKVYSISWHDKQTVNFESILGKTYYSEFKTASKKPSIHIPLRGIVVDDGDLYVSQFGSMLSGFQGVATVSSLAP